MVSFLVYRYAVVLTTLLLLYVVVRYGSWKVAVGLPAVLGLLVWLYAYLPLVQPYGLTPGTATSFDLALLSHAAARGEATDGFIAGRRSPRAGWSALGMLAAAGSPGRARRVMEYLSPALLFVFPLALFWFLRSFVELDVWVAATATFVGALTPTLTLDVFASHAVFHQAMFFVAPRRALSLTLALLGLGLSCRSSVAARVSAGAVLGGIAWLDTSIFVFAVLSISSRELLGTFRRSRARSFSWVTLATTIAVAAPAARQWFSSDVLERLPPSRVVEQYRLAFVDVLGVTTDFGLLIVLAIVGGVVGWRQSDARAPGLLALVLASYVVWMGSGVAYFLRPFAEAEVAFHLVRFAVSVLAGVGAFTVGSEIASALPEISKRMRIDFGAPAGKFALVVVLLLPVSAPFVWRPMMTDPLYYPSTYEWDASLVRLERFLLDSSRPDDVVVTGDETGEWIASLTGRRAYKVDSLLPREEARTRRQNMRRLFLSKESGELRDAMQNASADWLVVDPELREIYWEFDDTTLVESGVFRKVHQIGDRYAIFRFVEDTLESRRRTDGTRLEER